METFRRPPMLMFKHLHKIYICSRQFRNKAIRQSFGLSSSRTENDHDNKLRKLYQDDQLNKLWDYTFKRIASFQSNEKSMPFQLKSNFGNDESHRGSTSQDMPKFVSSAIGSNMIPKNLLDNQDLMKLSFAEGYLYGSRSDNRKQATIFKILSSMLQYSLIGLGVMVVYVLVTGESPLKRGLIGGSRLSDIKPENIDSEFADVVGCDESKRELQDVVEYLKNPNKYSQLGGKLPKGVLLVGPPGTGKTLLARAVAGEAGVPFFQAAGSEFEEFLVGQGARRVRDLFGKAKRHAPCVVFIDEIDTIGGKRSVSVLHPYANQTINQLLTELDGFTQNEGVIVIGATNRPNHLDQALLRPGRFDMQVVVPVPDYKGRKELLEYYLKKVRSAINIDIDTLCKNTIGFTGADIANMVNQAALKSATDNSEVVTFESLEFARDKILMGPERKGRVIDSQENRVIAFHESGHALVALLNEKADRLHKVTIISRNNSLGHTSTMPERELFNKTKEQLSASIDVILGGRVAEEIMFGSDGVTTGCVSDLKKANFLASRMVKEYGMSDKIGVRVLAKSNRSQEPSDAISELVDSEISRILNESKERVRGILTVNKDKLQLLAEALLKYETLDSEEVKLVIEGKDPKIINHEKDKKRGSIAGKLKITKPDRLQKGLYE